MHIWSLLFLVFQVHWIFPYRHLDYVFNKTSMHTLYRARLRWLLLRKTLLMSSGATTTHLPALSVCIMHTHPFIHTYIHTYRHTTYILIIILPGTLFSLGDNYTGMSVGAKVSFSSSFSVLYSTLTVFRRLYTRNLMHHFVVLMFVGEYDKTVEYSWRWRRGIATLSSFFSFLSLFLSLFFFFFFFRWFFSFPDGVSMNS
jgi:hypothetical protein